MPALRASGRALRLLTSGPLDSSPEREGQPRANALAQLVTPRHTRPSRVMRTFILLALIGALSVTFTATGT